MVESGFWTSPFGGFVVNLLASGTFEVGRGLQDRWRRRRAEGDLAELIADEIFKQIFYVAPDALKDWLDNLSSEQWRLLQSADPEDKASVLASVKSLLGSSTTNDQAHTALGIITTCVLACDRADFSERLDRADIHRALKEIKRDQEHILELILVEIYRLQHSTKNVYQRPPRVGRPRRFWVDPVPDSVVDRPDKLAEIIALLRTPSRSPVTVTSLRGAGGTGKTVLARGVCHRAEIWELFTGGVFWAVVGENPQLAEVASQLYSQLTGGGIPSTTNALLLLADELERDPEPALIVLDDVWDIETFRLLTSVMPQNVQILATTRGASLGLLEVKVDQMSEAEAISLLTRGVDVDAETTAVLIELARTLDYWALLVDMAASHLDRDLRSQDYRAVQSLASSIIADFKDDPTALDDESSRGRSFERMIDKSLIRLGSTLKSRFDHLAVFPADVEIPHAILPLLWNCSRTAARQTVRVLEECGLITVSPTGDISLHDLVVALLHQRVGLPGSAPLQAIHRRCCSVHEADLTPGLARWWHYHMLHAEQWEQLSSAFSLKVITRFGSLFGSDAPLLQICRSTADKLVAATRPTKARPAWVASRLTEGMLISTIRSLPSEVIVAIARCDRLEEACFYAAEAGDETKAAAVVGIHATEPANPDLTNWALATIDTIRSVGDRYKALAAIAGQVYATRPAKAREVLARALAAAETIDADGARCRAVATIAGELVAINFTNSQLLEWALTITDTIDNTYGDRDRALATIANQIRSTNPARATELLAGALITTDIGGPSDTCRTMATAAGRLYCADRPRANGLLDRAFTKAESILSPADRYRELFTIAGHFHAADPTNPELLDRALTITDTIDNTYGDRDRALATIASQVYATDPTRAGELLQPALIAKMTTGDDPYRPLARIAGLLHATDPINSLDQALAIVNIIATRGDRDQALATVADQLHKAGPTNPELIDRALAIASRIDNTYGGQDRALATIARRLYAIDPTQAIKLVDRALPVPARSRRDRDRMLATISDQPHSADPSAETLAQALAAIDTSEAIRLNRGDRASETVGGQPHTTEPINTELLDQELAAADAIDDTYGDWSEAVADIARRLYPAYPLRGDQLLNQALTTASVVDNGYGDRDRVLATIAGLIHAIDPANHDLMDRAMAVADMIHSRENREKALGTIAGQLQATDLAMIDLMLCRVDHLSERLTVLAGVCETAADPWLVQATADAILNLAGGTVLAHRS